VYTHIHINNPKIPEGEKTKGGGGTAVLCLLVSLGFTLLYFTLYMCACIASQFLGGASTDLRS
jgi:hypothetical protein